MTLHTHPPTENSMLAISQIGGVVLSVYADFGGVVLVVLALLVTWVIYTPNPLTLAKSSL